MTCVQSRATGASTSDSDWQELNKYVDSSDVSNTVNSAVNTLNISLNQREIFNRLTNNGTVRGLFFGDTEQTKNQLYINADYIATGILKSNNYAEDAATGKATAGTEIILSNGSIKSKNFNVDSQGNLTATGANITGDITANTLTLGAGVRIGTANINGLSAVATSGSYSDLTNTPPEFITEINNSGIKVHARSNINSNYTQIDANGMSIYKDGIKRASLGDTIVLGRDGYSQLSLDSSSLSFLNMVYGGNIVFSKTDDGNIFVCSYDYSEGSIPLWGAETGGVPWRTKLYLYNSPYVSGSMAVSEYLDANNIRVQGVQSVSYSGDGTLFFGGNSSQTSNTTLRGQSIDIYAHNSTNGITIGRSGQNVKINGNVTINGSAPGGGGVTMSQVENKIESYGYATESWANGRFLTSQSLSNYVKVNDPKITSSLSAYGLQAIAGSSSTLYFGPNSSYTCTTTLRGTNVNFNTHSGNKIKSNVSIDVTSDERVKNIFEIDSRYEDFFMNIHPILYKFIGQENRPTHIGYGARAIEKALIKSGLTLQDFDGISIDKNVHFSKDESYTGKE